MLIIAISLFVASPAAAAKSYYAERFDVQIDIQDDGSAIITETVEFHFSGDPFTFAFREISANETDGLTFLEAEMDGTQMPQGSRAGQVEVEPGDPLKVTWHFPPTTNAAHVFMVRYRADGVIRKDDADTLIWRAVPQDHGYPIAKSTVILTYPSRATLLGQPTLDWNFDSAWEDNRVVLTTGGLGEDEEVILTARFAPGSLTQAAPRWQTQRDQADAATAKALPIGLMAGIGTLVLGGLGLFTYARANRRELNISPVVSNARPPSDISPAVIGRLTGQQHNVMGAVFDLAQRGALEVREDKGFWGAKHYVLIRSAGHVALQPHEEGLMAALFKAGESRVSMGEIGTRLGTNNRLFEEPLAQELIQRGWLDPERRQRRTVLVVTGVAAIITAIAVLVLSLILGGISLERNPGWLPWIASAAGAGAALFLLSITLLIFASTYSTLTPSGEEQAARWKGFAEYLKQVSKGREPAIRPDYFERYLAYAAVFGLGARWAKYFKSLGGVPLPAWFHAMAGSDGDFGALVAVMSASDSAGAGAGAGGAAGASGGGSSGAG